MANLNATGRGFLILIPLISVLLWGTWSDRNRLRKPLLLLPMLGEVIKNICLILCVFIGPTNAEIAFVAENIFSLLFGNWTIMMLGAYSHILDSSRREDISVKVGGTSIASTIGVPLGSALSGVLLRWGEFIKIQMIY